MKKKMYLSILTGLLFSLAMSSSVFAIDSVFVGGKSSNYTTSPTQTVQGAKAIITTPSSFPSLVSGQATSAWVAVTNSVTHDIAQVGFASEPSVSSVNPHYFYGYISNGQPYQEIRKTFGPPTSTGLSYVIQKENGNWSGYENGNLVASISASVGPDSVQYYNETYDNDPKWIGTSSSKLKFSSVQFWDGSANATDTTKWVWKKPNIPSGNFISEMGSYIDTAPWSGSSLWYSFDL